jgi:Domain of unknown function (DUF4157)
MGSRAVVRHILHSPRPQPKLTVGAPNDAFEREADHVADQVMRMPEPEVAAAGPPPQVQRLCAECEDERRGKGTVQRLCSHCEDEMRAKEEPGETPEVPDGFAQRFTALHDAGQPLPASERAFFEPRFGRDFANVRLHAGPAASELASSVHARAFTVGDSIVLGAGQYAPGTSAGRQLLAHELTHVVQQGGGGGDQTVRRQTIHASCKEQEAVISEAWAEGQRLAHETAESLSHIVEFLELGGDPAKVAPEILQKIRNAFGIERFLRGDPDLLDLLDRFRRIEGGFTAGKTLRCDTDAAKTGKDECGWRIAFVLRGNSTDIFLCQSFFDSEKTLTERGGGLVHEMSHSVLGTVHKGIVEKTYPNALFNCGSAFGLEYKVAKQNAFAYEILADCLHGEQPSSDIEGKVTPREHRWSISGAAGADVTPKAQRFAAALGGRLSLRPDELVVFNPQIGVNLLYLPSSDSNPRPLLTAELGLRIRQPLKGFYFDVSAGGFTDIDFKSTRGLTGAVGAGFRWQQVELGAEARALVPGADFDRNEVLVFGRVAWRFGSKQ